MDVACLLILGSLYIASVALVRALYGLSKPS
jgi:hypothetical protein